MRQRVAGHVLDVLAAGPDDAAVGHHDLERQDRLARLAVLHAAQAPGVGAEVATDRAHLVARRVGRVEEALGGDRRLELGVDDPGLDDRDEVLAVDLDDLVHRGEGDRQAALDPGRATRQPRARAAGDDRDAQLGGDLDELGDVGGRRREDDGARQAGVEVRRLVVAVALAVDGVGQDADRPGRRARIAAMSGSLVAFPVVSAPGASGACGDCARHGLGPSWVVTAPVYAAVDVPGAGCSDPLALGAAPSRRGGTITSGP